MSGTILIYYIYYTGWGVGKQKKADHFYNISNVIEIHIWMPEDKWVELRNAQPHGGRCNFDYTGPRYDWYKTTRVAITFNPPYIYNPPFLGWDFLRRSYIVPDVGIRKKSFCGSQSQTKPALKLNLAKYLPSDEASIEELERSKEELDELEELEESIEELIGTKFITLNNSKQDRSYIRQPLGYFLFGLAGLPYSRCNFAHVYVNGEDLGIYINVEPIKKLHIKHNFGWEFNGHLYEIEHNEDFIDNKIDRIEYKGFHDHVPDYDYKIDLKLAAQEMRDSGIAGMEKVINMDQFILFLAMEVLLKHWDGYYKNLNNTYIYNYGDLHGTTTDSVNFNFIPWGIDQILQQHRSWSFNKKSVAGKLVLEDTNYNNQLKNKIRDLSNTLFSMERYEEDIKPFINKMETILTDEGISVDSSRIQTVRDQVQMVRPAALELVGEVP
jgi:hypothetical protein